jgi:hypothetical protein
VGAEAASPPRFPRRWLCCGQNFEELTMNAPIEQRTASPSNPPGARSERSRARRRFFVIAAIMIGLGAAMVAAGVHYHGLFGVVRGTVVEKGSNRPLEDVAVTILGIREGEGAKGPLTIEKRAFSNAAGIFAIRNTVSGSFQLSATKLGYRTLERDVTLGLAEQLDVGVLELERVGSGK